MQRKIIEIDEEKCNGCGICVNACHEGAIALVNGKAHLVSETYCDGLGACLPECPTGAIRMVEKEAAAFNEVALPQRHAAKPSSQSMPEHHQGCPGSATRRVEHAQSQRPVAEKLPSEEIVSELTSWPIQLKLVNPRAPYFENADLLIAADCTAFSRVSFHRDFMRGRVTLIGCPKLDDNEFYTQKLTEIFSSNPIHSIRVVRMEVPCCGGIVSAVKRAMLASETIVPYEEIVVGINGEVN
jgi:Pyruvate/2-oxoacid:ferredoxin oxidoreductase delta subunit